jgi:hypothetical protein
MKDLGATICRNLACPSPARPSQGRAIRYSPRAIAHANATAAAYAKALAAAWLPLLSLTRSPLEGRLNLRRLFTLVMILYSTRLD